MKLIKEFKEFAVKGNAVDMAVGIIIGGAFGKIVSSVVNDIIMPPIGLLMGGIKFTDLKFVLKKPQLDAATGNMLDPVSLNYGQFLQTTVDFLIIAFSIFIIIRALNSLKKKEEAKPAAPPAPTKEELLLAEIRDLLKAQK